MKKLTIGLLSTIVLWFATCSGGLGALMSMPEGPDPKTGQIVACVGCAVRPDLLIRFGLVAFVIGLVLKFISEVRSR